MFLHAMNGDRVFHHADERLLFFSRGRRRGELQPASSELSRAQKLPRIISAYSATAASPRTGSSRPALARCRWRAAPPARYPRTRFAASLAAVSESQNMTAAMTG